MDGISSTDDPTDTKLCTERKKRGNLDGYSTEYHIMAFFRVNLDEQLERDLNEARCQA